MLLVKIKVKLTSENSTFKKIPINHINKRTSTSKLLEDSGGSHITFNTCLLMCKNHIFIPPKKTKFILHPQFGVVAFSAPKVSIVHFVLQVYNLIINAVLPFNAVKKSFHYTVWQGSSIAAVQGVGDLAQV